MNEIILTHCGKVGDFLLSLPVASWLARNRGGRIHFVLPRCFEPFRYIERLLLAQPFTSRVTLVDYQVKNYDSGGQPYRFDPTAFGRIEWGKYYNLGFRHYPDKFLPAFFAEEHGFGYDQDFRLDIGPRASVHELGVYRSSEGAMARIIPSATPLPPAIDLLALARLLDRAGDVHTWFCGIAVLCWMADIPVHVYRVPGHAPRGLYFPEDRGITWHEIERVPEAVVA